MATTFNIKQIMLDYDVNETELAPVLYPDNKYPELALRRLLAGESNLTIDQLSTLADYLGVSPYVLFTDEGWHYTPSKGDTITLRRGDITALIRYGGTEITLRDRTQGTERVLIQPDKVTIKELIEMLNNELAKDLL